MRSALATNVLRSAILLALFAMLCTALVAFTFENTREAIAESEKQATLRALNSLVDAGSYNNSPFDDRIEVTDKLHLGSSKPVVVYRARLDGKAVAAAITVIAPQGYGGPIKLLVGIHADGRLAGVRIVDHKETPGLGDAIDQRKTDWLESFRGKSLDNPPATRWKVKKDGGVFDQFSGATISPRAVVDAVRLSLEYFQQHRDDLFRQAQDQQTPGAS